MDSDAACIGMFEGIGQGFLGNAIEIFFQFDRQISNNPMGNQACFNTGALFHGIDALM